MPCFVRCPIVNYSPSNYPNHSRPLILTPPPNTRHFPIEEIARVVPIEVLLQPGSSDLPCSRSTFLSFPMTTRRSTGRCGYICEPPYSSKPCIAKILCTKESPAFGYPLLHSLLQNLNQYHVFPPSSSLVPIYLYSCPIDLMERLRVYD